MKKRLLMGSAVMTTPDVPRYTPTTQNADLAVPRVTAAGADSFGSGLGEGLQRAAQSVSGVIKAEREKADRTATLQARTSLDQVEVDLLYNPQTGALAKRGKDAFTVDQSTLKAFDEQVVKFEGGLATDGQKQAFSLMAAQRRAEINKQLQRHISGELTSYADAANKASLESTLNNVSANYQDPDRIEQERKFGLAVIMSDTDNKGLPPEVVKAKVASWESMVHGAVVDRLVVDNPLKAKEYLDANAEKILPTERAKLTAQLKPLVKEQEINAAVDDVMSSLPPDADRGALISALHAKYKGSPYRQEMEGELRRLHGDRVAAREEAVNGAEKEVYSYLAKAKLEDRLPRKGDVPPETWAKLAKLSPEKAEKILSDIKRDQEHVEDRARQQEDRQEAKRERRENRATVESLTTWGMLKSNPDLLRATNLDKLVATGKITKAHYSDLLTDQVAIRQGKGEREGELLSNKAVVDLVLSSVKIDDKKDPERYGKFYEALNTRMTVFERENGRRPKQAEVKDLARGLLGEVAQNRDFWPGAKLVPAFEADPAKVRVPTADRAAIVQVLKANKRPVTEDAIRKLYLEKTVRKGGVQ